MCVHLWIGFSFPFSLPSTFCLVTTLSCWWLVHKCQCLGVFLFTYKKKRKNIIKLTHAHLKSPGISSTNIMNCAQTNFTSTIHFHFILTTSIVHITNFFLLHLLVHGDVCVCVCCLFDLLFANYHTFLFFLLKQLCVSCWITFFCSSPLLLLRRIFFFFFFTFFLFLFTHSFVCICLGSLPIYIRKFLSPFR